MHPRGRIPHRRPHPRPVTLASSICNPDPVSPFRFSFIAIRRSCLFASTNCHTGTISLIRLNFIAIDSPEQCTICSFSLPTSSSNTIHNTNYTAIFCSYRRPNGNPDN